MDTVLGPEMKSTGEVMGVADDSGELPRRKQQDGQAAAARHGLHSRHDHDKPQVADVARKFVDMGFKLVATAGTADVLENAGMTVERHCQKSRPP